MRTGDIVHHGPSKEDWLVAYAENGKVCACGWPCTLAEEADCQILQTASDESHVALLRELAAMRHTNDPRCLYARRVLATMPASRPKE